jgi:hypothetical protein
MTPGELRRRVEAVHAWAQAHDAAETVCPVCSGVKWVWRLEHAGVFVPRARMCYGHFSSSRRPPWGSRRCHPSLSSPAMRSPPTMSRPCTAT